MEFNSFGPAVGRLGSDSSRGGGKLRQSRSRGAEPPLAPLTLTTAYGQLLELKLLAFLSGTLHIYCSFLHTVQINDDDDDDDLRHTFVPYC